LRAPLPVPRDRVVAVPPAAGPLAHGAGPRRDRELVRPPLRVPQLRHGGRVAELPALRPPHLRRAVPEQPSPRLGPAELRGALVRDRPDVLGAPPARVARRDPPSRRRARASLVPSPLTGGSAMPATGR